MAHKATVGSPAPIRIQRSLGNEWLFNLRLIILLVHHTVKQLKLAIFLKINGKIIKKAFYIYFFIS
ncbi:hypothetical protein GT94_12170 [Geobacillus stearothermophilus]|nr:hypothetical protein GT94_12170 [Geobacillus stearothermophilus]